MKDSISNLNNTLFGENMKLFYFFVKYFILTYSIIYFLSSAYSEDEDIIKIGTLLPYSGVYTVLGEEITNAMELAFQEENNEIFGKKIKVIRGDTEVKPNIALQKGRKLISSNKVDI